MDLNLVWFFLLGVLLAGYAVLDGFDLGVGILHPFVPRSDAERRISMNSIGPLWDGNEVWLVTFGGALFAAFPNAYATIFSGFYTALMILLFALILRAVSMEFRSKLDAPAWRRLWDLAFFLGSAVATLLFGVAVGNAMVGIPLSAAGDFTGTLFDQLNPFALIVGLLAVALFAMHGSIYLYLKTEGEYQQKIQPWMWRTFFVFLFLYILTSIYALAAVPSATANFKHVPWAAAVPVLNALAVANIPRAIHLGRPGYAFLSSCATILALTFLLAAAIFPNLVASSTPDVGPSLTIYNSASSPKTLGIMLIIAAVGMPCVLAYTAVIYWTFRGKVQIGEHSY
jgi:cytochrome d ubiquinol oxidase subunit II